MHSRLRYLLLQVRDADDPMRDQEVACFSRVLGAAPDQICTFDLLTRAPSAQELAAADLVLLGGSGDYSVAEGGPWLGPALDAMRELHARAKPTFASCWGFQAMARALGGEVITDITRAEVGTLPLQVTPAGREDPLFGLLGERFLAQMGHQDVVTKLPPDAVLLASSDRVQNQAFCFRGLPIYCTQFHAELSRDDLLERVQRYPQYLERISGKPLAEFARTVQETPHARNLLPRFVEMVFGE